MEVDGDASAKEDKKKKKGSKDDEVKKSDKSEDTAEAKKKEEKEEAGEESAAKPEKRATRGSTRKQSVSIAPPQITLQQMEQMAKGGMIYDMEVMNDLMAQTYASAIKWPKDKVLILRLTQIIDCVQTGKWPVEVGFSLGDHMGDIPDMPENPFDQRPEATIIQKEKEAADAKSKTPIKDDDKKTSKIRQILTSPLTNKQGNPDVVDDDPIAK